MSRDLGRGRLRASLFAAVLLSAAAHAAIVFVLDAREPVAASVATVPAGIRANLALPAAASPLPSAATAVVPVRRHASVVPTRGIASAASSPGIDRVAVVSDAQDEHVDQRPKPLTYPVISLPPDDDPRRIGLVRLMLVVSSEGRVVKTVVTAATLSQDYVDRITESFEAVRFEPAMVNGLPRAGWYEVVVDFAFDPEARSAV